MPTQIWSVTDITFCHYRPIFALIPHYWPQKSKFWKNENNTWRCHHFTNMYHKWQSYDIWLLRYKCIFFCHLGPFFAILSPSQPKKWKHQKNEKKKCLEISSFYTSVLKNHDHMLSCSWDMARDIFNYYHFYFSFWAILFPFTPQLPKKWKFQKNDKNAWGHVQKI